MAQDINILLGTSASSTSAWWPYRTSNSRNKIQYILTEEELLDFGIKTNDRITAISFKVGTSKSTRDINNLRIRMKTVNIELLEVWETTGLTLVYEATISSAEFTASTWYKHIFNKNNGVFIYKGGNLLIEVSRDDISTASSGSIFAQSGLISGKLRYYAANSGTYPFDDVSATASSSIPDTILTIEPPEYKEEGYYLSEKITLLEESCIKFTSEESEDTSIEIYISDDQMNWIKIYDNDLVEIGDWWLKVILITENSEQTPILKRIWFQEPTAPLDTLLLEFSNMNRFRNVKDQLTLSYDMGDGNLKGINKYVESFEESFLPEDLIPNPNIGTQAKFDMTLNANISFILISFTEGYIGNPEKFDLSLDATITFIDMYPVNP